MMKCIEHLNVSIKIILVNKDHNFAKKRLFSFYIGFITREELRDVLRHLNHNISEKLISDVLNEIDADHDGRISYEEFARMLQDT